MWHFHFCPSPCMSVYLFNEVKAPTRWTIRWTDPCLLAPRRIYNSGELHSIGRLNNNHQVSKTFFLNMKSYLFCSFYDLKFYVHFLNIFCFGGVQGKQISPVSLLLCSQCHASGFSRLSSSKPNIQPITICRTAQRNTQGEQQQLHRTLFTLSPRWSSRSLLIWQNVECI